MSGVTSYVRLLAASGLLVLLLSTSLSAQRLAVGTRVEVDGKWDGRELVVEKVVEEAADEYVEIKGYADRIDIESRTLFIGPFTIVCPGGIDIEDDHDDDEDYDFEELESGWRLKIDVEPMGALRYRAVEIDVDRKSPREDPPTLEIEAFVSGIARETDGTRRIVLLGVTCRIPPAVDVPAGVFTKEPERDEDEDRPSTQLQIGRLTIGGEIQVDFEFEDNYNLDDGDNEDEGIIETSMILEGLFRFSPGSYIFAKGRTAIQGVLVEEDRDVDNTEVTILEELNYFYDGFLHPDLAVLVGRQDYDDPREWLYDENLDAVRLIYSPYPWEIEYSWSTYLADAPRGRSDVYNQILLARYFYGSDSYLGAYMVDIQDRSRDDVSPFFLGLRARSETDRQIYWFDYAYVDGVDGNSEIESHGLDVGYAHRFEDLPTEPYAYVGYAWGKGDGRDNGRSDRAFRQTGYQDNNDNFFGEASFRYYGELFEPELSNLHIATLGVGFEPVRDVTFDLLLHRYTQDRRATFLRDTNLRADPNGRSRDLGYEIDLIAGWDDLFGRVDLELDLGVFLPGSAFDDDDPAYWSAMQIEWNF